MKRIYICFIIFLIFIILLFQNTTNANKYYCNWYNDYLKFSKINNYKMKNILIIGDSRMFNINQKSEYLNIPNNIYFDSLNGAKITFLQGKRNFEINFELEKLNNMSNSYVIFNLGVNDLNNKDFDVINIAMDYLNIYEFFVKKYKNIKFVFLSVNPVIEDKLKPDIYVTNKNINKFNLYMEEIIEKLNYDNFIYMNSYNKIDFDSEDGVHYTTETDRKILTYIIENVVFA